MNKNMCFTSSLSSNGYVNFIEKSKIASGSIIPLCFSNREKVFDIAVDFEKKFTNKGYETEIILNPIDLKVTGIIVKDLDIGFINFYPYEKEYCLSKEMPNSKNLSNGNDHINVSYTYLKSAKKLHDLWEEIYIDAINFEPIDSLKRDLIKNIFENSISEKGKAKVRKRFFGATTYKGPKDYLKAIIEPIKRRYFIKGRPGTGKSTFMKDFVEEGTKLGYDIDVYYCSFDPNSLDMVVIKELDFCIFDSTYPHEYFADRKDDIILDFYDLAFEKNFDNKNESELASIKRLYSSNISLAVREIRTAKEYYDDYEKNDKSLNKMYDENKEIDIVNLMMNSYL